MNALRPKRPSPQLVNAALGDALRSATPHNDFAAALAVTHRGLHEGFPSETIRLWLRDCNESERFALVASSPRRFSPVLSKARARRAASSSPEGRAAMIDGSAVALVGYLFSPPPVAKTKARLVSVPTTVTREDGTKIRSRSLVEKPGLTSAQIAAARHVLALVGVDVIKSIRDEGRDSVLASQQDLAVRMGCTPTTVGNALKAAVEAGWLSLRSKRHGSASRYAIRGVATPKTGQEFTMKLPAGTRDTAWSFVDTVNAVADLALGRDHVADLILLADHPAWGHAPKPGPGAESGSRRDGKVWLTALASEAEVDPTTLGVSPLAAKQGVAAWLRINFGHDVGADLRAVLDADARATGAGLAVVDARAKRAAAIVARNVSLDEARQRSEQADKGATALLGKDPAPPLAADKETRREWLDRVTARVNASPYMDDAMRRALAKVLVKKLVAKPSIYDRPTAVVVAGRIAGVPEPRATAAA